MQTVWDNGWLVFAVGLGVLAGLSWIWGKAVRASVLAVAALVFLGAHFWSTDTIGSEDDGPSSSGATSAPVQMSQPTATP